MKDGKINIGFIGAGNIASIHMEQCKKLSDLCTLGGVTDANRQLAENRAEQYGIAQVYASADELLASPELDAVVVCVPNRYHEPYTIRALEAGKHVLLEKPMAVDLQAAKNIVKASKRSQATLMIAHQMRFESIPRQIKERLDAGELGRIYTAKTGWLRRKGIPGWGTWFTRRTESGGGPLIDIGVHMLDLTLYLMGNPKPVAVSGAVYAEFGPHRRGIGSWGAPNWEGSFDVEDLASAFIRMEDGSTLALDVSWAAHLDTDELPYVQLLGTEGGASYRGNAGKLLFEQDGVLSETVLSKRTEDGDARVAMLRHFLDCIREGKEPITPVMSGYTSNLIIDAIYRSSELGREVELDWEI